MKIVHYPHPALRHPAKPVSTIDKRLRLQIGEMFDLMYEAKGVGLAATQVAIPCQLLVMNLTVKSDSPGMEEVFINPAIVARKGSVEDNEGCLSFPGLYAKVRRAREVTIEAYDLSGEKLRIEAKDMAARAWQHELDHLNGVLFIDRFSTIAKLSNHRSIAGFEARFRKAQERGDIPADVDLKATLDALERELAGHFDQ